MIRRLLYKFHRWVWDYDSNEIKLSAGNTVSPVRHSTEPDINGMRFTVMSARGGTIIQMSLYDRKKDEQHNTTYVIPEGEDIASQVGSIVSMEMLKL